MSPIKQEIQEYISVLPDNALEALRPILALLISGEPIVETNLTDDERQIIAKGRAEYAKGLYIPLSEI